MHYLESFFHFQIQDESFNIDWAAPTGWPPRARMFWDRQAIRRGIAVPALEQFESLMKKLDTGQPITVTAIGSSIIKDLGGCFASSLEAVKRLGFHSTTIFQIYLCHYI
jgi:hypothetical protein